MIKRNKKQLIISSIIILLPVLAGLIMWNMLPERIATHWNARGVADGFSGRSFTIFGIPIIMLILQWICILGTAMDPRNKEQNNKVFGMVLWIIPLISLLLNGMVYAIALGNELTLILSCAFSLV